MPQPPTHQHFRQEPYPWEAVPGKRHHYVPLFQLRRFGVDPANKKTLIWALDKPTGKPERVNPINEAVIGRYYRIIAPDGTVNDEADEKLDEFETHAADAVTKIAEPGYKIDGADVEALILYILTLKLRTPQARAAARENNNRINEMMLETLLSDRERFRQSELRAGRDPEASEPIRQRLLAELRAGDPVLESDPGQEISMMFMSLASSGEKLFAELGIRCLRVSNQSRAVFVTSDNPVAHFDPTPKSPDAGVSFMSSPNAITFIALDPHFGLLLTQEHPREWSEETLGDTDVDELNLLTYAWAAEKVYGRSQEAVTRVRAFARRNRRLLGEIHYRAPRVWLARVDEGTSDGGPVTFTSRQNGKTIRRTFNVSAQGMEDARRNAWPPEPTADDESASAA